MGRNRPAFSEYDLNGDGKITEKEFNEARSKRISERAQQGYQMRNLGSAPSFADIDTNGDGEISTEEFAAHQSQRPQ
jgi:Ca2+-binding EF-hand superfamily protein